jgi:hypothetical protein
VSVSQAEGVAVVAVVQGRGSRYRMTRDQDPKQSQYRGATIVPNSLFVLGWSVNYSDINLILEQPQHSLSVELTYLVSTSALGTLLDELSRLLFR